ncbi:MAG TPA: phosphoribosylglycinamide formyltransferase [Bacteroidetes bacterium]|jgi:phosphoribosylglycinamide formyltransferase-1|nr:phosphoribosylglycinamide formyltransferase [Bacteroidota bacterium]
MIQVEIWASGGGTNADAIMQYFKGDDVIKITALGCNRKAAGAFAVAQKHSVRAHYWGKDDWNAATILEQLKKRKIDFIILAGFLKLVPSEVTEAFEGKIVNIHPSLLPLYGGKDMYGDHVHEAVLANQDHQTGITIHEVNAEFDKGKMLAQYGTNLNPSTETLASIKTKIQALEHTHFAPTIEAWIKEKVGF